MVQQSTEFKQITENYLYLQNPAPFGSIYDEELPQTLSLGGGLSYGRLGYRELAVGDASGFYRDFHEHHTGSFREPLRACLQRYPNSQLFILWLREPITNDSPELTGFLAMRYLADGVLAECEGGCAGNDETKDVLKAFRDQMIRVASAQGSSAPSNLTCVVNGPARMDFRS